MHYISVEKLELAQGDQELILSTIAQIQKDFSRAQIELNLNLEKKIDYSELMTLMSDIVSHQLEVNYSTFFSALYLLDIPENKVKEALFSDNKENVLEQISRLIINRELIKVLTKKHYAQSSK